MGRSNSRKNLKHGGWGEKTEHPADRPKTTPKAPKIKPAQPALPSMTDFWAVAPVRSPAAKNQEDQDKHHKLIEDARTDLWKTMTDFHFDTLPFLSHFEMYRLGLSFDFLPELSKHAHGNFLLFLKSVFEWMADHTHAYSTEPEAKAVFYAFGRMEYYNCLAAKPRSTRSRAIASALASLDVQLFVKVIEAIVDARGAFLELEERLMRASPIIKVATGPEHGTESWEPSNRGAERVIRGLVVGLTKNRGVEGNEPSRSTEVGMTATAADHEEMAGVEGEEWKDDSHTGDNDWPPALLDDLGRAVDQWTKCLARRDKSGRGLSWERTFGGYKMSRSA
ncbi:hypothetical protein GE09DRAFT_1282592 [Coniochaeta sp. 2T2.1]|nr:hypothetical protein GE09DRAFT_1282592 [Coniochaeta sp. 2T2.1]